MGHFKNVLKHITIEQRPQSVYWMIYIILVNFFKAKLWIMKADSTLSQCLSYTWGGPGGILQLGRVVGAAALLLLEGEGRTRRVVGARVPDERARRRREERRRGVHRRRLRMMKEWFRTTRSFSGIIQGVPSARGSGLGWLCFLLLSQFCLGRWEFGIIGWAELLGKIAGHKISKSTYPSLGPAKSPCRVNMILVKVKNWKTKSIS